MKLDCTLWLGKCFMYGISFDFSTNQPWEVDIIITARYKVHLHFSDGKFASIFVVSLRKVGDPL